MARERVEKGEIMDFLETLRNRYILADGAMGTYYAQICHTEGRMAEQANLTQPRQIAAIHRAYIDAGARLLRTNSFASHAFGLTGLPLHQAEDRDRVLRMIYENVYQAYRIAQEAAGDALDPIWIAGDIGPIPTGGGVSEADLLLQYRTIADALLDAGAGIILFETFADFEYILPTVRYIRARAAAPVIMTSFCLNKFGYTKSGLSAAEILSTAAGSGLIDVAGFNCGIGSTHMKRVIGKLDLGSMPVTVMPNSGYPDMIRDRNVYQDNVDYFCENMMGIAAMGVNVLGGCCGTAPSYIRALGRALSSCPELDEDMMRMRRHFVSLNFRRGIDKTKNAFLNRLNDGKKVIAVELDPPHDGHPDKMIQAAAMLHRTGADLITFSDSPMGKMRADAIMSAALIQQQAEAAVMPHVCCRDKNMIALGASFFGAHMNGIRNMLVVTGDPVPAGDRDAISSVYDFNSIRLMNYFKQLNSEYFADDPIIYGGALNYGRANIDAEIERMQKKCDAGADYFLTQPIYSDADIERIRYVKEKTGAKILCGIMPLVSYRNALFMKNEIYGISVPDEIVSRYDPGMSRAQGEQTGIEIALEIAAKLCDVADGYYLMAPFNRAAMICRIMRKLPGAACPDV